SIDETRGSTGQLLSRLDCSTFAGAIQFRKKACFLFVYHLPSRAAPAGSSARGLAVHRREEFLSVESDQVGISRRGSEFPERRRRPYSLTAFFRRKSGGNLGSSPLRVTRCPAQPTTLHLLDPGSLAGGHLRRRDVHCHRLVCESDARRVPGRHPGGFQLFHLYLWPEPGELLDPRAGRPRTWRRCKCLRLSQRGPFGLRTPKFLGRL